jgi:hypothetical protein
MRRIVFVAVAILCGFITKQNPRYVDNVRNWMLHTIQFRQSSTADKFELAQQVSNRCATPYFYCILPGYAPIGTPCWCASPNGPVAGSVR